MTLTADRRAELIGGCPLFTGLVPAANRLLGTGATAFLLPWWQALARTEAVRPGEARVLVLAKPRPAASRPHRARSAA